MIPVPTLLRLLFVFVMVIFVGCYDERISKLEKQNQELQSDMNKMKTTILADYDLQTKCSRDARDFFFGGFYTRSASETAQTIVQNYTTHYYKVENICYMLVLDYYRFKGQSWVSEESLWGVNQGVQHAFLRVNHIVRLTPTTHNVNDSVVECEVFNQECKTVDEFNDLVRPYMNQ